MIKPIYLKRYLTTVGGSGTNNVIHFPQSCGNTSGLINKEHDFFDGP